MPETKVGRESLKLRSLFEALATPWMEVLVDSLAVLILPKFCQTIDEHSIAFRDESQGEFSPILII